MPISPQIERSSGATYRGYTATGALSVVLAALTPMAGCGAPNVAPADSRTPEAPFQIATEDEEQPAAPSPGPIHTPAPVDPMEPWTYAPSLDAFHQIWQDRFAISAAETLEADTLMPYADALAFQGASWGLSPDDITLLVLRSDGTHYRVAGPHHPAPGAAQDALPMDSETALGRIARRAAEPGALAHDYDGLTLCLAGPVTARASCLDCHAYAVDSVVAILSYRFSEIADD